MALANGTLTNFTNASTPLLWHAAQVSRGPLLCPMIRTPCNVKRSTSFPVHIQMSVMSRRRNVRSWHVGISPFKIET